MKILITGHRGFVGRHFWRTLHDQGHDLTGVDIADPTSQDARWFFRADTTRFDLVVHLAAVVGGRQMIDGAPLSVAVDLAIDAEMFQWALRTRPRRIVYYSSSAAYPIALQNGDGCQPLREDDLPLSGVEFVGMPDMTYGWAKLTGETLAGYAEAEGLRVHIFRPFSGYGADQDPAYPFRAFIDRARRRDDPFRIWGDGEQVRDWIHIDDVVAATLAAVEQDVPGPINLCTGRGTSFNDLAKLVCAEAGYSPAFEHLTSKPTGVQRRVGDPTRMLTYYQPAVTMEQGIQRALRGT